MSNEFSTTQTITWETEIDAISLPAYALLSGQDIVDMSIQLEPWLVRGEE